MSWDDLAAASLARQFPDDPGTVAERVRAIGDVLPLKYFVKLVNAVYLHGHGFWTQPGALAVLGAWGAAGLVFTVFKFRWEPRES